MAKKVTKDAGWSSEEAKAMRRRSLLFIDEIKARGGYKKLYTQEHTNKVIRQQGISMENFYQLFYRMPEGIGLYHNPVLLSAILTDMAYPANVLFQDDNIPLSSTTLKLGPGVANELKDIMAHAFRQTLQKPLRQAGLMKRFWGAICILYKAKDLREKDNYTDALNHLFYQYSIWDHKLYPHSRTKDIGPLDRLCKHCMQYNSEDSGKLLMLAYLLYEIIRIGRSLTNLTVYSKKLPAGQKPMMEGFFFQNNLSTSDALYYLRTIPQSFEKLVQNYFEPDYLNSEGTGMTIDMGTSFSLINTTVSQCLQYAEYCLERLLKLNMETGVKSSSGPSMTDYQFDKLVGLNPKLSARLTVSFDSKLKEDFKYLTDCLIHFFDSN